jgi:hypothetical protein
MLKNLCILSILLLLWSVPAMAENTFFLKIDLTHSETSRDSNSRQYIVEIHGKELSSRYISTGYPFSDAAHDAEQRTLTDLNISHMP